MKFAGKDPKECLNLYDRDIVYQARKENLISDAEEAILKLCHFKGFHWNGRKEVVKTLLDNGWIIIVDNPLAKRSLAYQEKMLKVSEEGFSARQALLQKMASLDIQPDWY